MKRLLFILFLLALAASRLAAQGMPIDSLQERLTKAFSADMFASLHDAIPIRYDDQRVWGLAIGDFSSDGKPDLAISLYDLAVHPREVTVLLMQNIDGKKFKTMFKKNYSYIETPIEVGLAIEGYGIYVIQKSNDQEWRQEGYTIYAGDVITLDEFATRNIELPVGATKSKSIGYETYRNYETLLTKEKYFDLKNAQEMLNVSFFSFPAYNRTRNVYPGYGHEMFDTSTKFVIKGGIHRRDANDLSIEKSFAGYDEEYIYYSIRVTDDQIWGGNETQEKNDRVSLWFDTWQSGSRYFSKPKKGNLPSFRTAADSNIYNIIFSLPDIQSKNPRLTISTAALMTDAQQEASKLIRGVVERDTVDGKIVGYTLKARIPFAFLGFESNPITAYENRASENMFESDEARQKKSAKEKRLIEQDDEYPMIGFTAVVHDIDNPALPDEVTQQATSKLNPNDPTTFGQLILIPVGKFYGNVQPTYMKTLTEELLKTGY